MQPIDYYLCGLEQNPSFDFKNSLAPWIGKTMKLIEHRIEDVLAENQIDLSRMQFVILKTIQNNEGICQNQLAFFSNRNKSSLTRMINTLIKKGYITRKTSKQDKRKNTMDISELGTRIIKKATPYFEQIAELVEKDMSADEISFAKEILKKIQNNVTNQDECFLLK